MRPFVLLVFALAYILTSPASAEILETEQGLAGQARTEIEAGLSLQRFDYAEQFDEPTFKSEENGTLPGIAVRAATIVGDMYLGANLDLFGMGASLTYDGTTQVGTPLPAMKTPSSVLNLEGRIGYLIEDHGWEHFSLYTGVGFHRWYRGTKDQIKIGETYRWPYLPLGAKYDVRVARSLWIGADVAALVSLGGSLSAELGQFDSRLGDTEIPLGGGFGVRASFPVNWEITSGLSFVTTPYVSLQHIGLGDNRQVVAKSGQMTNLVIHEPPSRTWQYGLMASSRISF